VKTLVEAQAGALQCQILLAFGPSADVYAYFRNNIQRNLYRIPIP
jgi:hypothetical protein